MAQFEDFDIVIRHASGKVIAAIPQLGIFAESETVDTAIQKLKEEYAQHAVSAQANFSPQFETPYATQHRPAHGLGVFAIKTAIVTGMLALALIVFTSVIADRIEELSHIKIGGAPFWSKVERELANVADPANDMPEAKRQKLLSDIRVVVKRWRPFVTEASALFKESDSSSVPKSDARP